ncbi:enoyl-CoA hydratase, partial [Mycobacterium tuberculosis]
QGLMRRIEKMPKPVIGKINGFALGGGLELAMACHLRVAAETAKVGQPEVNLGLMPGFGGSQRLLRLCGRAAAL